MVDFAVRCAIIIVMRDSKFSIMVINSAIFFVLGVILYSIFLSSKTKEPDKPAKMSASSPFSLQSTKETPAVKVDCLKSNRFIVHEDSDKIPLSASKDGKHYVRAGNGVIVVVTHPEGHSTTNAVDLKGRKRMNLSVPNTSEVNGTLKMDIYSPSWKLIEHQERSLTYLDYKKAFGSCDIFMRNAKDGKVLRARAVRVSKEKKMLNFSYPEAGDYAYVASGCGIPEDESGEVEFECVFFNRENETVQFKTTIKAKVEPKAGSDGSRTHFTKIDVLTWVGNERFKWVEELL